jgi:hypothetical protein
MTLLCDVMSCNVFLPLLPTYCLQADSIPFRRLLVKDHTSDRQLEDRSKAITDPLLLSAYKRFEVRCSCNAEAVSAVLQHLLPISTYCQ